MEKTFKYDLGKEEGEEAFSGNITFKVKKGLLSNPKVDNFAFFIKDGKSIESYSRYNHSNLGVYGKRTDNVSEMDYDSLNKRLTDFGVFLSRDGNKITTDKALENTETVRGEDGSLKSIAVSHVKYHDGDDEVVYRIKADIREDGVWNVKDSKIMTAGYVSKGIAENNLKEYKEKLDIFNKYKERALKEFGVK
ncbi:MAG: hypothetical protein HZB68_03775 [Candidatus Aenigmarchaeota archaeon]|nr:hypothetical protein [Candidatus Aenigmarchaeota archaeon]